MAEDSNERLTGGCFSKLVVLILLTALCGVGIGVLFVTLAQDLSDLGGHGASAKGHAPRDLKLVLKNAVDRGYPLTLTEAEINLWLAATLTAKQGGVLDENIKLDRVWVRLEDGRAEVIMERSIAGKPFTVSMFFQVERMEGPQGVVTEIRLHGGPFFKDYANPTKGGRFGQLVVPQGFLILVMPAYRTLAAQFTEEIDLAFSRMTSISIENDRITLDPRQTTGEQGMPLNF